MASGSCPSLTVPKAESALFQGDHRRAGIAFRAALRRAWQLGIDQMLYESLIGMAAVQAAAGDPALAARLNGSAAALLAERLDSAEVLEDQLREHSDALLARARVRLGGSWDDEYAAGARLDVDAAVALALSAPLPAREGMVCLLWPGRLDCE